MNRAAGKRRAPNAMPLTPHSSEGHTDEDTSAPSSRARHGVCSACRKSKVKCDLCNPCSRCQRLDLECTPTPPSRRGLPGKQNPKRMRVEAVKMTKYEGIMVNRVTEESATPPAPSVHIGSLYVVREWLAVATRRRSCELLAKAFSLAAQSNLPLDMILDPTDSAASHGVSPESPCPVSFLCGLLRVPPTTSFGVGATITPDEVPLEMLHEVGCTSWEDGWNYAHLQEMGQKRFGVSSLFAQSVASWDTLVDTYQTCDAGDVTPSKFMELVFPKADVPKAYALYGSMMNAYRDGPPPPQSCMIRMNRTHGKPIEGKLFLSFRFDKDFMFVFQHFVPMSNRRNDDHAKHTHSGVQTAGAALPPPPVVQAVNASGRLDQGGLRDIGELLDSVGPAAPASTVPFFANHHPMGFRF
eukprot:m.144134 g.144134  ORF g.144134 m.144134 type:complete len:412 (-) comp11594_c0_seq5:86-1321(-)